MNNNLVLTTFLSQINECLEDISKIYSSDKRFVAARLYLDGIKQTNPKMILKMWKTRVTDKYYEEIEKGNIDYFIEKDFASEDGYSQSIDAIITELKDSIKTMSPSNKTIMIQYLQNLCKLSTLYVF